MDTVLLIGPKADEPFTDDLQSSMEDAGFTVLRIADPASLTQATTAIAVVSGNEDPWLAEDLKKCHAAHKPVLVIALDDVEIPECMASYRCLQNSDSGVRMNSATSWLTQVLDRSESEFSPEAPPSMPSAFWNRRLALASGDIQRGAGAIFSLIAGSVQRCAVAIARDVVITPGEDLPAQGCVLRLPSGDVPVSAAGPAKDIAAFRLSSPVPNFIPLSSNAPMDPAVAVLRIDRERRCKLSLGWLTSGVDGDFTHDVAKAFPGAAIISLETGALLGLQIRPGRAIPSAHIRQLIPPGLAVEAPRPEVLESADYLESRPAAGDYADRIGYDPEFLGVSVPLPKTSADVAILKYTNFSVGLHRKRQLSLYAVVNIDGKRTVEEHRSGDPWQLDPRVADDLQIGKKYYEGTPLDRGHMVRRIDPVWGRNFKQAELDTFHYPNSCPQHKNLNRKTWNDLEDYVYVHLKDDKQKVTVFTGPVLAGDDPVFHGKKLPKEFWKVVVFRRPDGALAATAYLLSQEDMIRGLEFVFGQFRTYQVTVALIEKKTGLDFGDLRKRDPKAKKGTLESAAPPQEVRGAEDLDLAMEDVREVSEAPPAMGGARVVAAVQTEPASLWTDVSDAEDQFKTALETFDWKTVETLAESLIARLAQDPSHFDEPFARRILTGLQRKRRFTAMTRVGDAFIQAGLNSHQVRRRYAQALIEQGLFQAAWLVLAALTSDPQAPPFEQDEAQGLLGRVSKQIYVNARTPGNPRNAAELQNAVNAYWLTYTVNRSENFWHGINVVACLSRAARDQVSVRSVADPSKIAEEILATIRQRETRSRTGELAAFELATRMEAHVALGQFNDALACARTYARAKDADAFEIASTLRQMEEVWQLTDDSEPGASLLPLLRAAHLERIGGALQMSASSVKKELQKVFGSDKSQSLLWYQLGLLRAASVARIEMNDKGVGTAWLLDAGRLAGRAAPRILMITNAHVIGPDVPDRHPEAIRPEDATVHFQIDGTKTRVAKVVYHSPVQKLDAVLFELTEIPPGVMPLELDASVIKRSDPPQRLYIIGHPGGRGLEFSLQDNHLLAANDRLVHYRTPSEGGASGSPVFGPVDWKAIALHHAGSREMPKIDGSGTYEANEGIALSALQRALVAWKA